MGSRHSGQSFVTHEDHLRHLEKEGFEVNEPAYSTVLGWAVTIMSAPKLLNNEWRVDVKDGNRDIPDVLVSNLYPKQMLLNEIRDIQCEISRECVLTQGRIDLIAERLKIIHTGLCAIGDLEDGGSGSKDRRN